MKLLRLDANKLKNTLIDIFSHPLAGFAVGAIGVVVGIIGIILAVYIFIDSQRIPELMYSINSARTGIVRSGQASRLSVAYDGKPIESDITGAQIAFWNQGKLPVKSENILKPIVLSTEDGSPILEATIQRTNRDVIGLDLDRSSLSRGRVTILFKILEQYDGGVIQLIYGAGSDTKFKVEGVIEGQKQIKQPNSILEYPRDAPFPFILIAIELPFLSLYFVPSIVTYRYFRTKMNYKRMMLIQSIVFLVTLPVGLLLLRVFMNRILNPTSSPFGF